MAAAELYSLMLVSTAALLALSALLAVAALLQAGLKGTIVSTE